VFEKIIAESESFLLRQHLPRRIKKNKFLITLINMEGKSATETEV